MKKKYILILSLILCGCLGLTGITKLIKAAKDYQLEDYRAKYLPINENYIGADFQGGQIAYRVDKVIKENINTFETWIRVDEGVNTRGVIFGNYCYYSKATSSNWQITADGNVQVYWGGTTITFTSYDARNAEWTHIAVVRDEAQQKFLLYVNGEYKEASTTFASADVSGNKYLHHIGGDCTESNRKHPFLGEIGQVTCYSTAKSAEEIKKDFQEYDKISHSTRDESLIFNTMLQIGDEVASDNSINANHARLVTMNYFYEDALFETKDYSFVVLGDTQGLARANEAALHTYKDWIIEQKDEKKISAVFHMGDITYGNPEVPEAKWNAHWEAAAKPMKELRTQVPFVCVPGNHDYPNNAKGDRNLDKFNQYFPANEFETLSYYGGAYEKGKTQNTYYFMEFDNIEYLVIALELRPENAVMNWACNLMKQYSDKRVIITTHDFLNEAWEMSAGDGYFSQDVDRVIAKDMWEKYLCKQENLFMILCGHSVTDDIGYKELTGENGNTVMAFMIDPSNVLAQSGLDTITALFTVDEKESKLYLNYFSIDKNKLFNIQNQRVIDFSGFTTLTKSYYESR